jgi:hypothetical protein
MISTAAAAAIAVALTFVWLGMVLAISFLEAPLKFRAPGVTRPVGLGIGRLVFRALNCGEAVLAAAITGAVLAMDATTAVAACDAFAVALLAAQLGLVRPRLNRRASQVLTAKSAAPRSRAHAYYIAAEIAKVAALTGLGVSLLTM